MIFNCHLLFKVLYLPYSLGGSSPPSGDSPYTVYISYTHLSNVPIPLVSFVAPATQNVEKGHPILSPGRRKHPSKTTYGFGELVQDHFDTKTIS